MYFTSILWHIINMVIWISFNVVSNTSHNYDSSSSSLFASQVRSITCGWSYPVYRRHQHRALLGSGGNTVAGQHIWSDQTGDPTRTPNTTARKTPGHWWEKGKNVEFGAVFQTWIRLNLRCLQQMAKSDLGTGLNCVWKTVCECNTWVNDITFFSYLLIYLKINYKCKSCMTSMINMFLFC